MEQALGTWKVVIVFYLLMLVVKAYSVTHRVSRIFHHYVGKQISRPGLPHINHPG